MNLDVRRGQRHAIIGPNGAGKSTLFNLISGLFVPTSGDILLAGSIAGLPRPDQPRGLSRSFQITTSISSPERGREPAHRRSRPPWHRFSLFRPVANARGEQPGPRAPRKAAAQTGEQWPAISPIPSSARSRSAWRWPPTPTSSCSTSRPPACRGTNREDGRADPRGDEGQDAAGRRARHERRLGLCARPRSWSTARSWRAAARTLRANRGVQEAYLGEEAASWPARGRGPACPLRQEPHPARGRSRDRRRRNRLAARPQRLRPLDHTQDDHGAGASDAGAVRLDGATSRSARIRIARAGSASSRRSARCSPT